MVELVAGVILRVMSQPDGRSIWAPVVLSGALLVTVLVLVQTVRPPDPYGFILLLLALGPVFWGLWVRQQRENAWLRSQALAKNRKPLPGWARALGLLPVVGAWGLYKAGVPSPFPGITFVLGMAVVVLVSWRLAKRGSGDETEAERG